MRTAWLMALAAITLFCGCGYRDRPDVATDIKVETIGEHASPINIENLPVLDYTPYQGDQVLLDHKLTKDESQLFREMDRAVVQAENGDDIEKDYNLVAEIGAKHGITREQSIAFWIRTTFSFFE